MSVDIATPGMILLASSRRERYASRVYPRRMRSRTVVLPLCVFMCMHVLNVRACVDCECVCYVCVCVLRER